MVTSLDKTKASVTIGEAIGYGNTASGIESSCVQHGNEPRNQNP